MTGEEAYSKETSSRHTGILGRFFNEMVSDAVGAKVLGKRSERTLSPVSPIRCVESKAESGLTSSGIPMPSVWRTRNGGPPRDLQADLQRANVRSDGTLW